MPVTKSNQLVSRSVLESHLGRAVRALTTRHQLRVELDTWKTLWSPCNHSFCFASTIQLIKPLEQIVYPIRLQKDHWKKLQQLQQECRIGLWNRTANIDLCCVSCWLQLCCQMTITRKQTPLSKTPNQANLTKQLDNCHIGNSWGEMKLIWIKNTIFAENLLWNFQWICNSVCLWSVQWCSTFHAVGI